MKPTTRENLAQFIDAEMLPDGLVQRIELMEKYAERSGSAIVPYPALLAICAMYRADAKGLDVPAEIKLTEQKPIDQDAPRFATADEVRAEEMKVAKAVAELREAAEQETQWKVALAEKRRENMAKAREARKMKQEAVVPAE